MTTEEKNQIIAVFMGFTPHRNKKWMNVPLGEDLKYKAFTIAIEKLDYHQNWSLLMPVVEKINLEWESDNSTEEDWDKYKEVLLIVISSSIGFVHEAVYQFCKWRETQKK